MCPSVRPLNQKETDPSFLTECAPLHAEVARLRNALAGATPSRSEAALAAALQQVGWAQPAVAATAPPNAAGVVAMVQDGPQLAEGHPPPDSAAAAEAAAAGSEDDEEYSAGDYFVRGESDLSGLDDDSEYFDYGWRGGVVQWRRPQLINNAGEEEED